MTTIMMAKKGRKFDYSNPNRNRSWRYRRLLGKCYRRRIRRQGSKRNSGSWKFIRRRFKGGGSDFGIRPCVDVHAHAVGQTPQGLDQLGGGAGDHLDVDVAPETELAPQERGRPDELGHSVVGAAPYRGAEEEALDVVAFVEGGRDLRDLPGREGGARHVVAAAVDAVGAVVDAVVGEQQFQQGHAAPVVAPGVADTRRAGAMKIKFSC